jgi:hypothetical protein
MTEYFGQQTYPQTDSGPAQQAVWNQNNYSCPGSGNQIVEEISVRINTYSSGQIRVGVYGASNNALVVEGTAAVTPGGTGWQGHMNNATCKNAGGSSPGVLIGGQSYKLGYAQSSSSLAGGSNTNGSIWYASGNYMTGMPATINTGNTAASVHAALRCGVNPQSVLDMSIKRILLCG